LEDPLAEYKPFGTEAWELFNLTNDPAERKNLAAENPGKVKAMIALWESYVRENNVILPSRSVFETMGRPAASTCSRRCGLPAVDL